MAKPVHKTWWFWLKHLQWQMYWSSWGLSYTLYPQDETDPEEAFLIIGPLQMRWWIYR